MKISVIMSTYNETEEELHKSIDSMLNQTFPDFEFIIVNDNPQNQMLKDVLNTIQDSRVVVLENEVNLGLVKSLNRALSHATGDIIVRADADDINAENRIEFQLKMLEEQDLDLIGSHVDLIDESGSRLNTVLKYPRAHKQIRFFLRWGPCLPHPTWMGRREVFDTLKGYRDVPYCEDYDFQVRAVNCGFRLGNVQEPLLKYRIRGASISIRNATKQYIVKEYISRTRKFPKTQEQINDFLKSEEFLRKCEELDRYMEGKEDVRSGNIFKLISVISNRYFWIRYTEKMISKLRQHIG